MSMYRLSLTIAVLAMAMSSCGTGSGRSTSACGPAAEEFRRAYNEGAFGRAVAAFAFDEDGSGIDYHDAPAGADRVQITERAMLERYLRHRFALGERFSHFDDGRVERQVGGESRRGSAKLICRSGRLRTVVMFTQPSSGAVSASVCPITETTTHVAGGHTVHGKRDGNVFFYLYPGGQERPLERDVKFLVFLDDPGEDPPAHIRLRAVSLSSLTTKIYEPGRHRSSFGWDWGMNFEFEPGCWWLEVNSPRHHGAVIVEVH